MPASVRQLDLRRSVRPDTRPSWKVCVSLIALLPFLAAAPAYAEDTWTTVRPGSNCPSDDGRSPRHLGCTDRSLPGEHRAACIFGYARCGARGRCPPVPRTLARSWPSTRTGRMVRRRSSWPSRTGSSGPPASRTTRSRASGASWAAPAEGLHGRPGRPWMSHGGSQTRRVLRTTSTMPPAPTGS